MIKQLLYLQNCYTVLYQLWNSYIELNFLWAVDFIYRISSCISAADYMARKKRLFVKNNYNLFL